MPLTAYTSTGTVTIPSSVTIPEGKTSLTFAIGTAQTSSDYDASIWAQLPGGPQGANIRLIPPELVGVKLGVSKVGSNGSIPVTITMNAPVAADTSVGVYADTDSIGSTAVSSSVGGSATFTGKIRVFAVPKDFLAHLTFYTNNVKIVVPLQLTAAAEVTSLGVSAPSAIAGASLTGTVTLDGPAATGGQVVTLASSNPGAASVPSQVVVPAGATSASFNVGTFGVVSDTSVNLTGTGGSWNASSTLIVKAASITAVSPYATTTAGNSQMPGTIYLNGLAPSAGGPVALTSSNTNALTVPAWVSVPGQTSRGSFTIITLPVSVNTPVTLSATYRGLTKTVGLTVTPLLGIRSLSFNANTAISGQSVTGTLTLSQMVSSNTAVSLSGTNLPYGAVPTSVTVPSGANSVSFTNRVAGVSVSTLVTVIAKMNGSSVTRSFTVVPASLQVLSAVKSSITSGQSTSVSVYLNGYAPIGGGVVSLSCSSGGTLSSSSVTIPSQSNHASFSLTGGSVTTATTVTITATYQGISKQATVTVNP